MENFDNDFIKVYEEESNEPLYLEKPKKEPFFDKILSFITKKKDYQKVETIEEAPEEEISVFEHIKNDPTLNNLTRENHLAVREAITLSEEGIKLFRQKLMYLNRARTNSSKILNLDIFNRLSNKELDYLKMILNRYQSLMKEKNVVNAQLTSFNKT